VFVHFSEIVADGFRTLHEGDPVEFEVRDSDEGQATNVIRA
jgi:CspA family cold shock protein